MTEPTEADVHIRQGWVTDPHDREFLPSLIEAAWGLIANAGGWPGKDWASEGWPDAAVAWRERFHAWLEAGRPGVFDTRPDLVVVSRSEMTVLFGKWGLPPWPNGAGEYVLGGDVDCAPLAQEIAADIAALCAAHQQWGEGS